MTIKPVVMHTFHRTDGEGRTREITEVLDVDPNMTIQELAERVLAIRPGAFYLASNPDKRPEDGTEPELIPSPHTHLTVKVAQPVERAGTF